MFAVGLGLGPSSDFYASDGSGVWTVPCFPGIAVDGLGSQSFVDSSQVRVLVGLCTALPSWTGTGVVGWIGPWRLYASPDRGSSSFALG